MTEKTPGAVIAEKHIVHWEHVKFLYRVGVLSSREIGRQEGVSHTMINRRAADEEWPRDLKAKVQARADARVAKAMVASSISTENRITEEQRVEVEAELQCRARLSHRTDIADTRSLFRSLLLEVRAETDSRGLFQSLGELLDTSGQDQTGTWRQDKLNELYKKVISTTGRIDGAKKLTEMLEKLVKLERQAFGIADTVDDKDGSDQVLKSLGAKLRAQLAA